MMAFEKAIKKIKFVKREEDYDFDDYLVDIHTGKVKVNENNIEYNRKEESNDGEFSNICS